MTIFILNILTVIVALSALRYVMDFWLFSIVYSFQTHIGFLVALASVVFLLAGKHKRYAAILLACGTLLAGHSLFIKGYFNKRPVVSAEVPRFKLVEFNMLYNNTANIEDVKNFIASSDADAIFLLEAETMRQHLEALDAAFPHRLGCGNKTSTCDLVILSKHPIEDGRFDNLSRLWPHRLAKAQVNFEGKQVTLAATHLSKPYFDNYHSGELLQLYYRLRNVKGHVILAGDFNSSVLAPDMQKTIEMLDLNSFHGEPATWPVSLGPFGIGIDHVFAREPAQVEHLERLDNNMGSNHFGLRATIALNDE